MTRRRQRRSSASAFFCGRTLTSSPSASSWAEDAASCRTHPKSRRARPTSRAAKRAPRFFFLRAPSRATARRIPPSGVSRRAFDSVFASASSYPRRTERRAVTSKRLPCSGFRVARRGDPSRRRAWTPWTAPRGERSPNAPRRAGRESPQSMFSFSRRTRHRRAPSPLRRRGARRGNSASRTRRSRPSREKITRDRRRFSPSPRATRGARRARRRRRADPPTPAAAPRGRRARRSTPAGRSEWTGQRRVASR